MEINGINQQNLMYYNQGVNNNFTLTNSYANAPIFTGVNKTNIDSFQNSQAVVSKDGKDDGSIGFFGAVGNLFKGVGNFFKGMVCDESGKFSWTRTLTTIGIGAAIGVACTMLPAITIAGTAFSTLGLISAGFLGFAGLHAGSAAIDIMSAKTDAEAEQAWQGMGSALTEGGLAYLGYRASGGIMAKDTVAPTPSGSAPKTPKTPKTTAEEAPVEPTRTSAPKTETPVEEPVVTTPKAEPVIEEIVLPKETVTERPAMTMTDEAKVQYNQTKSLLENTKHRVSADAIDEQFATPKELIEMREFYGKTEAEAKVKPVAEKPVAKSPVVEEPIASTPKAKPVIKKPEIATNIIQKQNTQYIYEESIPLHDTRSVHNNNRYIREFFQYGEEYLSQRRSKPVTIETIDIINKIDMQFTKLKPLEEPLVTYRGVCEDGFSKSSVRYLEKLREVNVGDEFMLDEGYSYSALSKSEATNFVNNGDKGILIEMTYDTGTPISITSEYGGEALAPRGMKYIVEKKQINEDGSGYLKIKNVLSTKSPEPIQKSQELLDFEKIWRESDDI